MPPDAKVELDRTPDGGWWKGLRLKPGRYQYKFIIDGDWVADAANPRRARSSLGTDNSVIDVPVPVGRERRQPTQFVDPAGKPATRPIEIR